MNRIQSSYLMLLFIVASLALTGCDFLFPEVGSGNRAMDEREVPEFFAVDVNGDPTVVQIAMADKHQVIVSGDDNLLDIVDTRVVAGRLIIGVERPFRAKVPLRVIVKTPDLRMVNMHGTSSVSISDVESKHLNLRIIGAATVTVEGKTEYLDLVVRGTARVLGKDLVSTHAAVRLAGNAKVELCALDRLQVNITGSGEIAYFCGPNVVSHELGSDGILEAR